MEYIFSILNIQTSLKEKNIIVTANMDISEKDIIVELYEQASKEAASYVFEVVNDTIIITFSEYPKVNTAYFLTIKNIKSVTNDMLKVPVSKRLYFKSAIVSTAKIINPAFFEEVDDIKVTVKEETTTPITANVTGSEDNVHGNHEIVGSYYLEIAKDNAFIDKVVETFFSKNTIKLSVANAGQYYARVRVQRDIKNSIGEDIEYGNWSETTTFTYKHIPIASGDIFEEDVFIPVIENDIDPVLDLEELELIEAPEQGVSGESFIFEFNMPIDNLNLGEITIIRKGIK